MTTAKPVYKDHGEILSFYTVAMHLLIGNHNNVSRKGSYPMNKDLNIFMVYMKIIVIHSSGKGCSFAALFNPIQLNSIRFKYIYFSTVTAR